MTVSEYGREGEKAFKYTEILESDVDVDSLFGDLIDHWIRYEDWDEERDEIYPDEDTLFRGLREGKEIRLKDKNDKVMIEYGLETQLEYSLDYVESVWQDEVKNVLERNGDVDIQDHHVIERTFENLFNNQRRVKT